MPKKPIMLPCMFCGEMPCQCNKAATKAPPKPRAKKAPAEADVAAPAAPSAPATPLPSRVARPSAIDAMKAASAAQGDARASAASAAATTATAENDALEVEIGDGYGVNTDGLPGALRNMWSMLHPDEKVAHSVTVGEDWARNERRLDWLRKAGMSND